MLRRLLLLWLLLVTLILAACGGADEVIEPEDVVAPVAATAVPQASPAESEEKGTAASNHTFMIVAGESQASYIVAEEFFQGAVDRLGEALGLTDTIGSTSEIVGEVQLTDSLELVAGQFTVNINSLTSDQGRRDEKIREDWLQSDMFPEAVFVVTAVSNLPAAADGQVDFQMSGDMTIREVTHPVTFDVTASLDGDTLTGTATATMRMTDYGFEPPTIANLFSVADEFTVEVQFTAREG